MTAVLDHLAALAGWTYLIVALFVVADAVFPLVPAELAVVSASVLAASGRLALPAVIAATAAGALVGDGLAYLLGRGAGRLGVGRLLRHPRSRRVLVWAAEHLNRRAVPVLVAGRFVPGGRTATTVTAGFLRVRPPVFLLATAIGGTLWATYAGGLGYLVGRAATTHPWIGVLAAVIALTLATVVAESTRRLANRGDRHDRHGRRGRLPDGALPDGPTPAGSTLASCAGRSR